MELIYLWVHDYLNIRNCGFNLSDRIKVIQENIGKQSISFNIVDNENYVEDFFGDNVSSVTGIIGANGVGKSNFLDYLKTFVKTKGAYNGYWVAIFFDKATQKLVIRNSFYLLDPRKNEKPPKNVESWHLDFQNKSRLGLSNSSSSSSDVFLVPNRSNPRNEFSEVTGTYLFYSPFLDMREYPTLTSYSDSHIDISTNYLIDFDSRHESDMRDKVEIHRYKNVERQFLFVQDNLQFVSELNLPTELEIRFVKEIENDPIRKGDHGFRVKEFYEKFRESISGKWNKTPNHLIDKGRRENSRATMEEGRKIKCKWWFAIDLVTNFLYRYSFVYHLHDEKFQVSSDLREFDFKNEDAVQLAKKFFSLNTFISPKKFDFIAFIDFVNEIIDNRAKIVADSDDNECYFYVSAKDGKSIWEWHNRYLDAFTKDIEKRGFLLMNWRDLSSGEKAFLDLFSRIYGALKKLPVTKSKYIYLLLDEAEAGFHPKWQQTYLTFILKFLSSFSGFRFHVIMTTHSPFIASDLPLENLILLAKDEGICVVKECFDSVQETFAANIHTLLADTFFMSDGVMGEFARSKIEELFKMDKNELLQNRRYFKAILNMIGEPIIKLKLSESYIEKLGANYEEELLSNEILSLQKRLEELKQKNNDQN